MGNMLIVWSVVRFPFVTFHLQCEYPPVAAFVGIFCQPLVHVVASSCASSIGANTVCGLEHIEMR